MDKKSKIIVWFLFLFLVTSIILTFLKYVVFHDYFLDMKINCDPMIESCFRHECNSEWEDCASDVEENISYYKILTRKAYNVPACNFELSDCEWDKCALNEKECEIFECDSEEVTEDDEMLEVTCSDREVYIKEKNELREVE